MDKKHLIEDYVSLVKSVYGEHIRKIILYGSYARGDFRDDSDIDIMILTDIDDAASVPYQQTLSGATFDFNLDHDTDFKPITHGEELFYRWRAAYPFFRNIEKEGIVLYGAA